jgi:single-strand selective monofunctional uracil DNA glycosylase
VTRTKDSTQTHAEAPSAAVQSPASSQDNLITNAQGAPRPPPSESPHLMTLALLPNAPHIAHFATQAASVMPPSANLDPLEALLARQPGTSRFTEFLRVTLLLRSKLATWQRELAPPLPGALRNRKDGKKQPRSTVLGYVYNPWVYASDPFARFLETYGPREPLDCLLLGMNPGPWGMTQTGVPLADPITATTHLDLTGQVTAPDGTHPRVPVTGFDSQETEGSATAVSTWMCQRWGFVVSYYLFGFVMNFCPLLMLDDGGTNITPADLRVTHPGMGALRDLCDAYLACVVWLYQPSWIITLGGYTQKRVAHVLRLTGLCETLQPIGLLHPSKLASSHWSGMFPSWAAYAEAQLIEAGFP